MTDTSQPQKPAHGPHTGQESGIAAHVQPIGGVLLTADAARMIVHWLGQLARLTADRYGAPEGLAEVQRALAEAVAVSRRREHSDTSAPVDLALGYGREISPDQAADLLGISADLVRWHCRRGNLVSRKVGRHTMIDAQSVREFAARRNERSA